MSSINIKTLLDHYPSTDLINAIKMHISENRLPYKWAVSYTDKHVTSNEPSHIGFASSPDEAFQYMSLPNANLIFNTIHIAPPKPTDGVNFSHQTIESGNLGALLTYYFYEASNTKAAIYFLERQIISDNYFYIIVKTPEGTVGKDLNGIYEL